MAVHHRDVEARVVDTRSGVGEARRDGHRVLASSHETSSDSRREEPAVLDQEDVAHEVVCGVAVVAGAVIGLPARGRTAPDLESAQVFLTSGSDRAENAAFTHG